MKADTLDWHRIEKALRQKARRLEKMALAESVLAKLPPLAMMCGPLTSSRRMLTKVGEVLLDSEAQIVAPVCPDYSHQDGRYTLQSLGNSVPWLAQLHVAFLAGITNLFPARVLFLIADQEAENIELCQAVKKTRNEFAEAVHQSMQATRAYLADRGWHIKAMTEVVPDLLQKETELADQITANQGFEGRIVSETIARADMYARIKPGMSVNEMQQRTRATAAQYIALGQYAAQQGWLVCNHTTTSLSWYLQTEVAVLHNPVEIY